MSPVGGAGRQRVVLIGFMGSGKSTVGRLLASRLGWEYVDTDAVIAERAGAPVTVIFRERGEPAFRELEAGVLEELRQRTRVVIATGGGAPTQDRNTSFFAAPGTAVFYLRVSLDTALQRTGTNRDRPLLAQGPAAVRALYGARLARYESMGVGVDTDGRDPADIATAILELLEKPVP